MKDLKFYFQKGIKEGFALGAFNFCNMEGLKGIVSASTEMKSPVIISVSEGALKYMGDNITIAMANSVKVNKSPIFLHLDHGKSYEVCKKAINLGFDSVMFDGSALSFEENIKITKKVVDYAHKKKVFVEGELGVLKGIEDTVSSNIHTYTNPQDAKKFVEKTGIDSLAVAIGTSHGAYKYSGKQELRIDILTEIEKLLPNFPIVLHGASTVNPLLIDKINKNGGELKKAIGINEDAIREVISHHNVVKINCDTDLRLAMTGAVRQILKNNPNEFDPRKYLGAGEESIKQIVKDKIENLLFSKHKQ